MVRTKIAAPVKLVWEFHERADALELLSPWWARPRVVRRDGGLEVGSMVELRLPVGPFGVKWVALHVACERGVMFADEQVEGPFAYWHHEHRMVAAGAGAELVDRVEWRLPGGRLVNGLAGWAVRWQLGRLFAYRHMVTRRVCERGAVPL